MMGLIDQFIDMAYPYLSRLIGNKERESMNQTVKQVDNSVLREKTGGLNIFGRSANSAP
jgi:hypothetical protein